MSLFFHSSKLLFSVIRRTSFVFDCTRMRHIRISSFRPSNRYHCSCWTFPFCHAAGIYWKEVSRFQIHSSGIFPKVRSSFGSQYFCCPFQLNNWDLYHKQEEQKPIESQGVVYCAINCLLYRCPSKLFAIRDTYRNWFLPQWCWLSPWLPHQPCWLNQAADMS